MWLMKDRVDVEFRSIKMHLNIAYLTSRAVSKLCSVTPLPAAAPYIRRRSEDEMMKGQLC